MEAILELGAWNWMILAAVLFVLELIAPGIFFMWFGLAAAVTGLIMFRYDISWQWQLIWFCGLSLASVLVVYRYLRKHPLESEQPLLNRRADHLVRCHTLHQAETDLRLVDFSFLNSEVRHGSSWYSWQVVNNEVVAGVGLTASWAQLAVMATGQNACAALASCLKDRFCLSLRG